MQLNYKMYGEGEPLIILHGLFGSLDNWHSIAKTLSEGFRTFIVDQRNHGKSPHTDFMDYPTMAADIAEFMDEKGLESAIVAGHSMGGKTAMKFALDYPMRVSKLISIDMTPFKVAGGHEEIIQALKAVDPTTVKSRKEADEKLKPFIDNFSIRQFLLKNLERNGAGGFQWKMNLPSIEACYQKILDGIGLDSQFSGPTLFVKGEQSDYLNETDLNKYQNLFPNAELETVSKAGHWVHAEAPKTFINLIANFIRQP